ncbi:hypothetical protein Ait01nite_096880 [Actinoplanes italicus]|uniref:RNA polymerase sigma-B factor n=2 Tax=Actinoplanes italicus TaxID=113567 RepID=A0A2T0KC42_9ACTN|nr:RNA polymerase sigma-B factor [Actinoplanes italicus]GIE36643.1 hypothetical protein Ait01nite_096880 [Actinoplanes italicus]
MASRDHGDPDELLAAMAALPVGHPDRAALRERAIETWLPMARRLAARYHGKGVPADDLVQTAAVGLIRAVDRFDPGFGVDFIGFAIPTILGELKRYFRDRAWMIRVPRRLQELRQEINLANEELTQSLRHPPTIVQIAAHLGITEEVVLEVIESARAYNAVSLSTPIRSQDTDELADSLGGVDPAFAAAETRITVTPALAGLDERDRRILTLRFYGNLTQSTIAQEIGISQMHVSRLIARALNRLRRELQP